MHPQGKEYLIVLFGKAILRIGDEKVELQAEDYVVIPNNIPDGLMEVKEEFTIVGMRYQAFPTTKSFLRLNYLTDQKQLSINQ